MNVDISHQYGVFGSWETPPLVGLAAAIEAALERTDSDQKMALLCSAIPHTAPLLRIQLCTHFPVETELGSMCYPPVVGRPLYHP